MEAIRSTSRRNFIRSFIKENSDEANTKRMASTILNAIREFQSMNDAHIFYELLPEELKKLTDKEWRMRKKSPPWVSAEIFFQEMLFQAGKCTYNDLRSESRAMLSVKNFLHLLTEYIPADQWNEVYNTLPGEIGEVWMEIIIDKR